MKKNRPTHTNGKPSALDSAKFTGTDNPRHLRVLAVLRRRPITRQELDNVAGCSNGPDLVSELRDRGLELKCKRIEFIDRDGRPCRPGVYSLTETDKRRVSAWLAKRQQHLFDRGAA